MFSPGSRGRLTDRDLDRFSGRTLFDRLARTVCHAGCLPRKELYEAWEVARRVRRLLRGGRVVDLGGGHGLLAHALMILDDSSPEAIVVDTAMPESAAKVHAELVREWPRLTGRVTFVEAKIDDVDLSADDLVVSSHACGALTDHVIDRALAVRARVAVLPCCHDLKASEARDFQGWVDGSLGIDLLRGVRLRTQGYRIWAQTIPASITPKNRLLIGSAESPSPTTCGPSRRAGRP